MDETIFTIIRSIYVSGTATLIALPIGIFLAYRLALRGISEWASTFLESFAGFPTVVLGLILYFILSSSGPLGYFHILYTPIAIIIGEAILVIPIVASIGYRLLREKVLRISELTTTLGGTKNQNMLILIQETFNGLLATTVMAFSRAIGELGVALMVGGNISGYTRVMTTAIALQISKGMFSDSLQLGLALVAIMVVIGIALKVLGGSLEVD
jgi:tungstate transport system permease protein